MSSDGSGPQKPETFLWTQPEDSSVGAANEWVRRASSHTGIAESKEHTAKRSDTTAGSINKAHAILKGRSALFSRITSSILFFMLPFAVVALLLAQSSPNNSPEPYVIFDVPLPDMVLANIDTHNDTVSTNADTTHTNKDARSATTNTAVTATNITDTTPIVAAAPVFATDGQVPTFTISQNITPQERIDLGPPATNLHLAPPLLD